ncbi:gamma-glutamyl-gamma-aminobutyrate hydrolase family protein [Agromyces bauzanensis]
MTGEAVPDITGRAPAKPLVGITGRRGTGAIMGAPHGFQDAPLEMYLSEYATSVQLAGGLAVHLAIDADPAELVERLDGVVIAGGEDVDPRRYGEAPGPHTNRIDPLRDEFEIGLVLAAIDAGIPVLGVCRGNQVINVALGGSLVQHLEIGTGESHASYAYPRQHRAHVVDARPGTTVERLYGAQFPVNSFHHQAVRRLGDGLIAAGSARDGVIESIEHRDAPVLGVQWHPETFGGDPAFDWLVETAIAIRTTEKAAA